MVELHDAEKIIQKGLGGQPQSPGYTEGVGQFQPRVGFETLG